MKRLLVLLMVLTAGITVAAFKVPSPAATVNGSAISRQAVSSDLTVVGSSSNFKCYVEADLALSSQSQSGIQVGGVGGNGSYNGTYNVKFVEYTIDQLIDNRLIQQVLQTETLRVTPSDLAIGRTLLTQGITTVLDNYARTFGLPGPPCGGSGAAVLSSVPQSFIAEQVLAQAGRALLEAHAAGTSLTTAAAEQYFAAYPAQFDTICVSDIAVTTSAEAAFIRGVIESGASSFAAQAQANSIDSSTKANGGAAGCVPAISFGLANPLITLAVGQISQPISDNGAYVLLTVISRSPGSFAASVNLVRSVILASGQARAQAQLTSALHLASISADPRYGRVINGSTNLLLPPLNPPASSLVSPLANIPAGVSTTLSG